ncbi:hypothetical protein TNCV_3790731 [Trichonephila clavipes]|nr:hypothetical protein TNCV_3790731 [Trichonephila clavipes]
MTTVLSFRHRRLVVGVMSSTSGATADPLLRGTDRGYNCRSTKSSRRCNVKVWRKESGTIILLSIGTIHEFSGQEPLGDRRWENSRHFLNCLPIISELGGQRFGPFFPRLSSVTKRDALTLYFRFPRFGDDSASGNFQCAPRHRRPWG